MPQHEKSELTNCVQPFCPLNLFLFLFVHTMVEGVRQESCGETTYLLLEKVEDL